MIPAMTTPLAGPLNSVLGDSDDGGSSDSGLGGIVDDLLGSGDHTTESNGGVVE